MHLKRAKQVVSYLLFHFSTVRQSFKQLSFLAILQQYVDVGGKLELFF